MATAGAWSRRRWWALLAPPALAWATVTLPAPAAAQTEGELSVARDFYEQGLAAEKEGRWEEAFTAYDKALAIRTTPQLALRAAICLEELNRLAKALVYLERANELAKLKELAQVVEVVEGRLEALRPRVPQLVIEVPNVPEGLVVRLDDAPVAPATFGALLPVDPGDHRIEAEAPGFEPYATSITVEPGTSESVAITLTAMPEEPAAERVPTPVTPPPGDEGPAAGDPDYLPGALVLGGGGVLVAVGAALLGVSVGREGEVDDLCGGSERLTCPLAERPTIEATLDEASTFRAAGYAVGGVGAAALVAGVVLLVVPPDAEEEQARRWSVGPVAGAPLGASLTVSF